MKNILIVDDAAFMRSMLKGILTSNGYTVVGEGQDGNDALAKYKELKPDLVTMDITMPNKNGLEALQSIMDFDKNAKVIMCTAMGQQSMVMDAIKIGAKDFIVKPFKAEKVVESIQRILKQ